MNELLKTKPKKIFKFSIRDQGESSLLKHIMRVIYDVLHLGLFERSISPIQGAAKKCQPHNSTSEWHTQSNSP
ncbi:unnamed protein product [Prunus armeniaca]|uniref:Uncharacterized protein n=1 Tax=Prunus armeniaca TaxID=36596 RepID=A0A6J5W292_PRUAR|nr:unnamed protein product [Prunus armeniaca]